MLNLTYECLNRYWQKDYMFVISRCAEQIIYCGARQDEFMLTRSEVEENFRINANEIQPCHLINAEFFAQSNASLCVITGNYRVVTDETADFFLQAQQRCTFVWEKTTEDPPYACLQSNRRTENSKRRSFPKHDGKNGTPLYDERNPASNRQRTCFCLR